MHLTIQVNKIIGSHKNIAQRFLAIVFQLLFPRKSDFEINGEIGSGLAVYHGHGTVINAYKIGCNFCALISKANIKVDNNTPNAAHNFIFIIVNANVAIPAA